jgi:hypothetical protein
MRVQINDRIGKEAALVVRITLQQITLLIPSSQQPLVLNLNTVNDEH